VRLDTEPHTKGMSTDTAAADRKAGAAAAAVRQAESDLAGGRRAISVDALHEARDKRRHAVLAARGERARAERAQEDARLAGLQEVGRQVDKLAASDLAGDLSEVLRAIADACARARAIAREWDVSVRELIEAARDLDVKEDPPGGAPWAPEGLAVRSLPGSQWVTHHRSRLTPVTADIARAIDRAVIGKPDDGLLLVQGVTELPEPRRPARVFHAPRGGQYHAVYTTDPLSEGWLAQIKSGALRELGADEIEAWMRGELA